jgi:hypothetical protein
MTVLERIRDKLPMLSASMFLTAVGKWQYAQDVVSTARAHSSLKGFYSQGIEKISQHPIRKWCVTFYLFWGLLWACRLT